MAEAADFLELTISNFRCQLPRWGLETTKIGGRNYFFRVDLEKIKAGRVRQKYGSGFRWVVSDNWNQAA